MPWAAERPVKHQKVLWVQKAPGGWGGSEESSTVPGINGFLSPELELSPEAPESLDAVTIPSDQFIQRARQGPSDRSMTMPSAFPLAAIIMRNDSVSVQRGN